MNSKKEVEAKLRKIEKELAKTKEKLAKAERKNKNINGLKQRIRELTKSRESWKAKLKSKQLEIKGLTAKISRGDKAKGHQYSIWLVGLSVMLRIYGGCSYGGIRRVLDVLNISFDLSLARIPCENTIQNWVSKMGLFLMEKGEEWSVGKQVSLIIDESIRLGQEKLLLLLSVPFTKLGQSALRFKGVKVVYMKGAKSWTGEKISEVIKTVKENYGFEVKNILSDEDGKILKACKLSNLAHIPDISHAVATCLRRVFDGAADFKAFKNLISSYVSKGVNQSLSYLCPPKQRTKARFMNLNRVVKWAKKLLFRFGKLNKKEAIFFEELPKQKEIISILSECLEVAQKISLPFKTKGLSITTLKQARQIIKSMSESQGYLGEFLKEMEGYLAQYQNFINKQVGLNIHASSEIIESMFGKYKSKANNYALTGLTTLNLELPIYGMPQREISKNMMQALQDISLLKLGKWKKDNSTDNQIIRRNEFFKIKK